MMAEGSAENGTPQSVVMNATTFPHKWDDQGFCAACGVSRRRVAAHDPYPCPSSVAVDVRSRETLHEAVTQALLERGPLSLDDNDDAMIAAAVVEAAYPTGAVTDLRLVPWREDVVARLHSDLVDEYGAQLRRLADLVGFDGDMEDVAETTEALITALWTAVRAAQDVAALASMQNLAPCSDVGCSCRVVNRLHEALAATDSANEEGE